MGHLGIRAVQEPQGRLDATNKGELSVDTHAYDNPVRSAERRYLQEHGSLAYDQLLKRLFDELFPAECACPDVIPTPASARICRTFPSVPAMELSLGARSRTQRMRTETQ